MQDSGDPYDVHLTRHLQRLLQRDDIPLRRDLFRYYHSDAESAIRSGADTRIALTGFSTDATHGYQPTHRDSLFALNRLLVAYMFSAPVFEHDQKSVLPLNNLRDQLGADSVSASDTLLPPLKGILSPDRRDH